MALYSIAGAVLGLESAPEDVEKYVTSLLDDIGPYGVMIASGCDIPSDAKPENVKAMADAAHNYLKTHPQN